MVTTSAERVREYREKYGLARTPPRLKECAICGEEFITHGYGGNRKFCGKECAKLHTTACAREAALVRAAKTKTATCATCGTVFKLAHHDTRGKYCSARCRGTGKNPKSKRVCCVCGKTFYRTAVNKTCSTECARLLRAHANHMQRRNGEAVRAISEAKAAAKAIIDRREFRRQCAVRLRMFKKLGSNAEVARAMGETEGKTHQYLSGCNGYRRAQRKRSEDSQWRRGSMRAGSLSKLFKTERQFVNAVTETLRNAGMIVESEVSMPGSTRRKIDLIAHTLFGRFGIECKNGNKTSDADQCMGQSLVKCRMRNLMPACCFPSDSTPDPDFMAVAASFGVAVGNEINIADKLMESTNETSIIHCLNTAD
jgi:hypothetical protein